MPEKVKHVILFLRMRELNLLLISLGDPCIDLAFARLEILWHFGKEMVNLFTNHYIHLCKTKGIELDLRSIAYWDLVAALRPCGVMQEWELPKEREQMMRLRHKEHVDTTLQTILNFEKI